MSDRREKLEIFAMLHKLVGRTLSDLVKFGAPKEYVKNTGHVFALINSVIGEYLVPGITPDEIDESLEDVDRKYDQFVANSYYNKTNTNIPN